MITSTEWMILRLIKTLNRPVTFPEMVHHIGEHKYLEIHRSHNHLKQLNAITETVDKEDGWIFVYWLTLEGVQLFEKHRFDYQGLPFAHPVQKEI